MIELLNTAFHDNANNPNFERGVTFWATGIVTGKHFECEPSNSGKDYTVVYINPFGEVVTEWRSFQEITLIELDAAQYHELKSAISSYI